MLRGKEIRSLDLRSSKCNLSHLLLHDGDGNEVEGGREVEAAVQEKGHAAEAEQETRLVGVPAQAGLTCIIRTKQNMTNNKLITMSSSTLFLFTNCMLNDAGQTGGNKS